MAKKYLGGGKWKTTYKKDKTSRPTRKPTSNNSSKNTGGGKKTKTTTKKTNNSNRDTTKTKDKAEKEFKEVEENILQGNVDVIPNPKLKAKQTILLQYLGKNLTGLYFVDSISHTFSANSGYTQILTVSRNGFGDTIKKGDGKVPIGQISPGSTLMGYDPQTSSTSTTRPSQSQPKPITPPKDDEIPVNKWGTVTARSGLNIRKDPSTKNKRLTAMPKGSRVYCISKKGEWYRVEWKGHKGWSYKSYIRLD